MRFFEVLHRVIGVLVCERRVTYQALQLEFGLDEAFLEGIRAELILAKRVARDENGTVLVWTGTEPAALLPTPAAPMTHDPAAEAWDPSPAATALPPLVLGAGAAVPAVALDAAPPVLSDALDGVAREPVLQSLSEAGPAPPAVADTPQDSAPPPARSAPEAERRQLTVMFCDLVGSTDLAGRLDPEDLREVVRAYQETAAAVIQRYEGHIAQYLGDGLLVYFGYPLAHEDDARRAVYTGLGLVDALGTLNTRLAQEYGVQLAVRLGLHTGPVVVGQMGGGGRQEQLALGETPNIAARLEGLAALNTVVISSVTARLVADAFVLETLGPQPLKGAPGSVAHGARGGATGGGAGAGVCL